MKTKPDDFCSPELSTTVVTGKTQAWLDMKLGFIGLEGTSYQAVTGSLVRPIDFVAYTVTPDLDEPTGTSHVSLVSASRWKTLTESRVCVEGCLFAEVLAQEENLFLLGLESEEGDYSQRWFSADTFNVAPSVGHEYHLEIRRFGNYYSFHLEPVAPPTVEQIEEARRSLQKRVAGL